MLIGRLSHIMKFQPWPAIQAVHVDSHTCCFILCSSSHPRPFQPNFPAPCDFLFHPCGHPSDNGLHCCYFKKKKKEGLGQPCLEQVYWRLYSNRIPSLTHILMILTVWAKKVFFERESIPDGVAVKMVERTITDLEYDINLVDKAETSSRGPTPTLKEVLRQVKCCPTALHTREIVHERESQSMWHTPVLPSFKKLPQPPPSSATTTLISQQPSTWR